MFEYSNNNIVQNIIDTSFKGDPIVYNNETAILNFFMIQEDDKSLEFDDELFSYLNISMI
jgi:hypothetical protein